MCKIHFSRRVSAAQASLHLIASLGLLGENGSGQLN